MQQGCYTRYIVDYQRFPIFNDGVRAALADMDDYGQSRTVTNSLGKLFGCGGTLGGCLFSGFFPEFYSMGEFVQPGLNFGFGDVAV